MYVYLNKHIKIIYRCVCGGGGGGREEGGGAVGRALVMTSGILYSVMRVEGSIWVEAPLLQFLEQETNPHLLLSTQEYK